ncbi:MAG: Rieske 2Fe-2S domain-containing protein [Microthrixaceae bacterium]
MAIALVVVLAAVALLGAARRRDADDAVGSLADETLKRDRQARKVAKAEADQPRQRTRRREGRRARTPRWLRGRRGRPGRTCRMDPAGSRDLRRDPPAVPQPFRVRADGAEHHGVRCRNRRLPVAVGLERLRLQDPHRQDHRRHRRHRVQRRASSTSPKGRMWITEYPAAALPKAETVYSPSQLAGMEAGVVALYQKCPHLGCRVPECKSSQWFECPCHGSQYNQVGEKKGGPAPRGMDGFAMEVSGGVLIVNTGQVIQGAAIGTNTTGQEAEGPHCIGGGGGGH